MSKFSIIVPVYNVEKYLEVCLNSVVNQYYQNYEVIIVCDKCTDDSEKIVDKYVKENKKFKKIFAQNTGLAKARNIGIEKATGDYLLFLDSDDYFNLDLLEVLNNSLDDKPELVRFQVAEVKGKEIINYHEEGFSLMNGKDAFNKIVSYHFVENSWAYCYERKFFIENKFKFMNNCIAEDYGITPLIIAKAKKVKSLSYVGYNYVQRENSLMNEKKYNQKLKKMDDMLKQARFLKKSDEIKNNKRIMMFINNSLIYYSTRLKYEDFKKYNKVLHKEGCYKTLQTRRLRSLIRNTLISINAYYFFNKVVK